MTEKSGVGRSVSRSRGLDAAEDAPVHGRYTITVCRSCGGLVGWEYLKAPWRNECPGGVVCRRERGTRTVVVTPTEVEK